MVLVAPIQPACLFVDVRNAIQLAWCPIEKSLRSPIPDSRVLALNCMLFACQWLHAAFGIAVNTNFGVFCNQKRQGMSSRLDKQQAARQCDTAAQNLLNQACIYLKCVLPAFCFI